MRIAIAGHRLLPQATEALVTAALDDALSSVPADVVGLSCLADGADTLFARAVLAHGGELEVIVPAEEYLSGLPEKHHAGYHALLARAARTRGRRCRTAGSPTSGARRTNSVSSARGRSSLTPWWPPVTMNSRRTARDAAGRPAG